MGFKCLKRERKGKTFLRNKILQGDIEMKKEYQKPECDFVAFSTADIVRTSPVMPTGAGFNDKNDMGNSDFM